MKTTSPKKTKDQAASLVIQDLASREQDKMNLPAWLQIKISPNALAQVVHVARARQRIRRAHTKGRSDVRGGGKKPWPQKGTGRARHASIRSPLWVGGGVTFGPRSRKTHLLTAPRALVRHALAAALSAHASQQTLRIVRMANDLPKKTKELFTLIGRQNKLLIIVSGQKKILGQVAANISGVQVKSVNQVTVTDTLSAGRIWIDEEALSTLQNRCS